MEPKLPWYYRNGALVVALLFCAPVGLLLVWVGAPWSRSIKVIASLMSLCLFGAFFAKDATRSHAAARQAARQEKGNQPGHSSPREEIQEPDTAEKAVLQAETAAETERRRPDLKIEQKSETDSAAETINFELSVFNVGRHAARMSDRCEITLTDGRTCIKKTSANFILRAFTRSPARTGKKEFIAPPELYDRLRDERTLPSGGEATLWAKFPFHEVQNCDMSKATARLNCNAAYAPIDAWPEAVDFLAARKNP